jgi:catechol 2,3-dioxygenase-like lactoylglutathione lyase family enzyme
LKKVLTHIALEVEDVAASTAFYKKWCGMDAVHSRATEQGQNVTWLASPGEEDVFVIVLIPGHHQPDSSHSIEHIGISVGSREELRQLANEARAAGLLRWDYQEHDYPVGDLFAITDPDGHTIEFSFGQPLGRDFRNENLGSAGPQP